MRNKKLFNRLMAIIMCSTLTVSTPIMTYATETENVEETLQTAEETQADENGFVIEGSVLTRYVGTYSRTRCSSRRSDTDWCICI